MWTVLACGPRVAAPLKLVRYEIVVQDRQHFRG